MSIIGGHAILKEFPVKHSDYQEIILSGEAYYMPPGHSIKVAAGTTLIEFSPIDEWNKLMQFAEKNRK